MTWRKALGVLAGLEILVLCLYWSTALAMGDIWNRSDTYAHGFVVPLISAWLAWRLRGSLVHIQPRPMPWVGVLVLGSAVLWLLGELVAVNSATQFALVAMMVFLVWAVLGWQVTRVLAFPLGFLFFAVPIGDFMMPMLMEWTADFTVVALRATGIPVYREGQSFVIPTGSWSVVEACSGIRYLIASVTVGSLFAYLSYRSTARRLAFVAVSILVPLVANWMRAYIIVMLGHYSGNTIATGVDHLIYGWLFFGVVIFIMFLVGARWAEPSGSLEASGGGTPGAIFHPSGVRSLVVTACLLVVIIVLPHGVSWGIQRSQNHVVPVISPIQPQSPWASSSALTDWRPAFDNPAATFQGHYVSTEGESVGLYLGYYRNQNYQSKLVSSSNVLVQTTNKAWARVNEVPATLSLGGQVVDVRAAELRRLDLELTNTDARLLVWQVYWVNGQLTVSDAKAKVLGALSRVTGKGDDGAVVILYTPWETNAAQVLQRFVDAHGDAILHRLRLTQEAAKPAD